MSNTSLKNSFNMEKSVQVDFLKIFPLGWSIRTFFLSGCVQTSLCKIQGLFKDF